MTANVIEVLEKIKSLDILEDELYFVGGTALSYYLNHRISEDIDIVSPVSLKYKSIIPSLKTLGAEQIQDDKSFALRLAGLYPNEYILKFVLDGVKLEFFQANRQIQLKILEDASYEFYDMSNLKILDLKSISKLKIVALLEREKSRDLFDFGAILKNEVLSTKEILEITSILKDINSIDKLKKYILNKKESIDDEAVYLNEDNPISLSFEEIKKNILKVFN